MEGTEESARLTRRSEEARRDCDAPVKPASFKALTVLRTCSMQGLKQHTRVGRSFYGGDPKDRMHVRKCQVGRRQRRRMKGHAPEVLVWHVLRRPTVLVNPKILWKEEMTVGMFVDRSREVVAHQSPLCPR